MLAVEWPLTRAPMRVLARGESAAADSVPSAAARRLAELKRRVPAAKEACGKRAWDALVSTPLPHVVEAATVRKASRAYFKMREVALSCALDRTHRSVHLCEAPGGFVQATGDDLAAPDWTWTAASLPDAPSAARRPTPAWDVLPTACGSFLELDVADAAACEAALPRDAADLVTADGAVDMDHDHLEERHFPLLVAQTRAMLHCAAAGSTYVCKFFEGSEACTLAFLAYLTGRFRNVGVLKPTASRPTNSERYVVCRGLLPTRVDEGALDALSEGRLLPAAAWVAETTATLDRMTEAQAAALSRVLHKATNGA